jgi:hypothetical protein
MKNSCAGMLKKNVAVAPATLVFGFFTLKMGAASEGMAGCTLTGGVASGVVWRVSDGGGNVCRVLNGLRWLAQVWAAGPGFFVVMLLLASAPTSLRCIMLQPAKFGMAIEIMSRG